MGESKTALHPAWYEGTPMQWCSFSSKAAWRCCSRKRPCHILLRIMEQVLYLLLGSADAWISIRVCAVGLPFKQPTPKVELLSVLLVQVVICLVILEREALQAITNSLVTPLVDPLGSLVTFLLGRWLAQEMSCYRLPLCTSARTQKWHLQVLFHT